MISELEQQRGDVELLWRRFQVRRLDRLLHHSVTISIRGESYRLKDKRKGGVFKTEEVRAQT
jgi:DNA replication protein DnaC